MDNSQKRKVSFDEASSSKRSRNDDDFKGVQPSRFESELASLQDSDATKDSTRGNPKAKWKRPPIPALDPEKDSIEFQQLDVENYVGKN
jgi:DNA polymerase delta subunit 1